jgi:hypothetical protein
LLGGTKQDVEEFNRTIFQDHRRGLHDRHPVSPNVRQSQFGVSVDTTRGIRERKRWGAILDDFRTAVRHAPWPEDLNVLLSQGG